MTSLHIEDKPSPALEQREAPPMESVYVGPNILVGKDAKTTSLPVPAPAPAPAPAPVPHRDHSPAPAHVHIRARAHTRLLLRPSPTTLDGRRPPTPKPHRLAVTGSDDLSGGHCAH